MIEMRDDWGPARAPGQDPTDGLGSIPSDGLRSISRRTFIAISLSTTGALLGILLVDDDGARVARLP